MKSIFSAKELNRKGALVSTLSDFLPVNKRAHKPVRYRLCSLVCLDSSKHIHNTNQLSTLLWGEGYSHYQNVRTSSLLFLKDAQVDQMELSHSAFLKTERGVVYD